MSSNKHQSGVVEPTSLEEILYAMNEAGGFRVSVLTSTEGLPIATVPADYDSDVTAAMVALLQRVGSDAQSQLGMAEMDEMTIYDRDRTRLVCRHITVGRERLILVALVPRGHCYRRATNQAIRQIRQLLS